MAKEDIEEIMKELPQLEEDLRKYILHTSIDHLTLVYNRITEIRQVLGTEIKDFKNKL